MTRPLLRTALLFTLPLVVGCASAAWYYSPSLTQLRADLPPGTPLPQVDSYLDQHQVEHSYFHHSHQITALVRNVRRDALVQADQSLIFSFDPAARLIDIQTSPAYTGP